MRAGGARALIRALAIVLGVVSIGGISGGISGGGAQAAGAVDELRQGPKIGAALGDLVRAPDQTGRDRDFQSLRGKRGLVLMFTRSFDW